MLKLFYRENPAKWLSFSKKEQLMNIASELSRIHHGEARGEADNTKSAYERCLDLIDMTIVDPKWHEETGELYQLRDAVASLYIGKITPEIPRLLYTLIVKMADKS